MGANDAAEMLEVAKEECGRLERELVAAKVNAEVAWGTARKALAERDASREVNAELLAARGDVAAENRRRGRLVNMGTSEIHSLHAELDAAYAVIAAVREVVDNEAIPDERHGDSWVMVEDLSPILAQSSTDLAAAHTADLAAQSAHYRDAPMNEGVGE